MTKNTQVPASVTNLRKLWNKKIKPQYTQIEAAKKLGWTQGAISQYLNNITEMNAAAIIKLANFMEVDPHEIDPNITEHLPEVVTITARYNSKNMSRKTNNKIHYKRKRDTFFIEINSSCRWPYAVLEVCEDDDLNAARYVVVLKGEKEGRICTQDELPPQEQIKKKYPVLTIYSGYNRLK